MIYDISKDDRPDEEFANCRNVDCYFESVAKMVLARCLTEREVKRAVELNGMPFPIHFLVSSGELFRRRQYREECLRSGLVDPFSLEAAEIARREWLFSDPQKEADAIIEAAGRLGRKIAKLQNARIFSLFCGSGDKSFGMAELVER